MINRWYYRFFHDFLEDRLLIADIVLAGIDTLNIGNILIDITNFWPWLEACVPVDLEFKIYLFSLELLNNITI